MIVQILKTSFFALGIGFLCQIAQDWLASYYLNDFLKANLINMLVALLAINTATMGIVLTKIRDLVDSHGHGDLFKSTRRQMLLSIKEQVSLIIVGVVLLTIADSTLLSQQVDNFNLLINSLVCGVFVYSMSVLYDVATSVLIIIDFDMEDSE